MHSAHRRKQSGLLSLVCVSTQGSGKRSRKVGWGWIKGSVSPEGRIALYLERFQIEFYWAVVKDGPTVQKKSREKCAIVGGQSRGPNGVGVKEEIVFHEKIPNM